jgi:carbamoyltransferase
MRQIVELREDGGFRLDLAYFRHHREKVEYQWDAGAPRVGSLHAARLAQLLGPARAQDGELTERHKDIACSAQAMYEEALFHLLNRLHERYGLDDLVLAGGCAMNSVANGKVCRSTPFKRIYVPPGAGDAGGAIGTALVAGQSRGAGGPRFVMDHAYWGPGFTDQEMGDLLAQQAEALGRNNCSVRLIATEDELARRTAAAIAAGQVVGWFQGRMEWGPRALGNRSILADPRRSDMKDILNRKIKRRESFRPFAPSILREAVADWFECDEDVPFMSQVYPIREEQRSQIPAVTHVDGTGRLQTVRRDSNPRFYSLIAKFAELTGVPMVLNTSFNENEPVVCRPAEALDCFLRTEMDILVLGLWMVERNAKVGC